MLVIVLVIGAFYSVGKWAPPLLVALVVAVIAGVLARRIGRVTRRLLAAPRLEIDYDRTPSRAERRLMRKSLRVAIARTELRSLFPTIVGRMD